MMSSASAVVLSLKPGLVGEEGLDSGQFLPFPIVGAVDIGLDGQPELF